jgi:hypothetical protein
MAMILNVFPERTDSLARIKTVGNFWFWMFWVWMAIKPRLHLATLMGFREATFAIIEI